MNCLDTDWDYNGENSNNFFTDNIYLAIKNNIFSDMYMVIY